MPKKVTDFEKSELEGVAQTEPVLTFLSVQSGLILKHMNPFKTIGVSGINTFSKDQYFSHERAIRPLLNVLKSETDVITTDIHGGVDLIVRMFKNFRNESNFETLKHRLSEPNVRLVTMSDAVFFFWDLKHKGIQRTMEYCQEVGKPYWVTYVESKAGSTKLVSRWRDVA